jgi:hypothetical protein
LINFDLSNGHRVSVVFHERKQFVEILAPLEVGIEADLARLLIELSMSPQAVTWTHARIDQRALFEATVKQCEQEHTERVSLPSHHPAPLANAVESFGSANMVRKIRSDIKVGTLEKKLGLKSGAIRNADGSDARSDKRLGTLRKEQRKKK